MEIKIEIDDSCKHCKKALVYLNKLYQRNKNAYMGFIIHPTPKSDKEMMDKKIKGITLTPDYNSAGHLTHFHIEKQK